MNLFNESLAYLKVFTATANNSLNVLNTAHNLDLVKDSCESNLALHQTFVGVPFAAPLSRDCIEMYVSYYRLHIQMVTFASFLVTLGGIVAFAICFTAIVRMHCKGTDTSTHKHLSALIKLLVGSF